MSTATSIALMTSRQRLILDAITDYTAVHGYAPTIRELADACDIPSTSMISFYRKIGAKAPSFSCGDEAPPL